MILHRNYGQAVPEVALPEVPHSEDYEILLQFDLKRQKQKNAILEQRLKNKQNFIQQMKHFQEQLTTAYEQCKNDLVLAQDKIQYLQTVQFRQYTERIADLKHLLSVKNQQSKRNSIGRDDKLTFTSFNSKMNRNRSEKGVKRESKTSSNFNTQREKSTADKMEHQVSKQIKKSTNFIVHFIQMAEVYLDDLKNEWKLTRKLKKSWKWIKEVVREWDQLTTKVRHFEKFKGGLTEALGTEKDMDTNILLQLIRNRLARQN